MKYFFLIGVAFVFICSASKLNAQRTYPFGKYIFSPSVGLTHTFSDLSTNPNTDELVNYFSPTSFTELLSFSYYFSEKWGVGLRLRTNHGRSGYDRTQRFNSLFQQRFGKDYFIGEEISINEPSFLSNSLTYIVGAEYRIVRNKWEVTPSFYFGATEFIFSSYAVQLKRAGSHEILTYWARFDDETNENRDFKSFLTLAPSIKVAYRLNRFLLVNSTLQFTTIKPQFTILETTENHLTESTQTIETNYSKRLNTIGFGFGVILELERLKKGLYEKYEDK